MPHRDDFDDDLLDESSEAYDYKPIASDESGGGKALKLFLSVTVIAGIAAAAWYYVGTPQTDGDNIPVVRAETSLTKKKPNDPGGMAVPNRDKTVYDRVDGVNTEPKLERLLPHSEKPLEKPTQGMALPEITKDLAPAPEVVEKVIPPSDVKLAPEAIENAKALPDVPAEEMAKDMTPPEPAGVIDENAPRALVKRGDIPTGPSKQDQDDLAEKIKEALMEETPEPEKTVEVAKVSPKTKPMATPTVKPQAPVKKGYLLQLLSSKSETAVNASWLKIKSKNADIVKTIPAHVVKADLGVEKGIYYRLRLGPVDTGDAAKSICSQLKKRKVGCFIVRVQ